MRAEVPDLLIEQRQLAADICAEIAAHHEAAHDPALPRRSPPRRSGC